MPRWSLTRLTQPYRLKVYFRAEVAGYEIVHQQVRRGRIVSLSRSGSSAQLCVQGILNINGCVTHDYEVLRSFQKHNTQDRHLKRSVNKSLQVSWAAATTNTQNQIFPQHHGWLKVLYNLVTAVHTQMHLLMPVH